jgi:DNA repair protein RadC
MEPLMREMPEEDRPREKLERLGVRALSNDELLALFLRTGVKGKSAIQIGREMLLRYGSMSQLGQLSLEDMKQCHGLGLAKASQLVAAFELGRRVALEQVQAVPLDSPAVIYDYFAPQMHHLPQERLVVALLNAKLHLIAAVDISTGTVSETLAHPREILHPVINRNAYAFFLMHNHPSGCPLPSRPDVQLTARVREASELMQIRFVDHVIIGRPAAGRLPYYSFREAGQIG